MFLEHQISILECFFQGSHDTEDWSNDCWKSNYAIISIKFENIFKQKTVILNGNYISEYYCFYCIFDQSKEALVSIRAF